MARSSTTAQCSSCRRFCSPVGTVCPDSKGLEYRACARYKKGHPFTPKIKGSSTRDVKFDPAVPCSWTFWISPHQVLLMMWDLDHNQYGHFRQFMIELDDHGVVKNQFTLRQSKPAFAGEIVAGGPRGNDLWRSFAHQDENQVDQEGNLINKPLELKLYPTRKD